MGIGAAAGHACSVPNPSDGRCDSARKPMLRGSRQGSSWLPQSFNGVGLQKQSSSPSGRPIGQPCASDDAWNIAERPGPSLPNSADEGIMTFDGP